MPRDSERRLRISTPHAPTAPLPSNAMPVFDVLNALWPSVKFWSFNASRKEGSSTDVKASSSTTNSRISSARGEGCKRSTLDRLRVLALAKDALPTWNTSRRVAATNYPREVDHTRQVQRRHLAEALATNLELLERRQVVEHERGRLAEASVADAERGEDRRRERERSDVRQRVGENGDGGQHGGV